MSNLTDVNASVEDKLEQAASSTTDTEVVETTQDSDGKENRIPQSRFNEVNSALKELKAEREQLASQLVEAQKATVKMAELLELKEADVQTLNDIKNLQHDPKVRDHVIAIDNALKGVVEEVESGKTTPEDATAKTQKLLEDARVELMDTQAEVQAEALVTRADVIADKLMAQLPDEYNDQDRAVIGELWVEKVDWDAAVAEPGNLASVLTDAFQSTLDRYGVPRGALFSSEEVEELTPKVATPITPEQELEELLKTDKLGVLKETKTASGKVLLTPEMSDADFTKSFASALKLAHSNKGKG